MSAVAAPYRKHYCEAPNADRLTDSGLETEVLRHDQHGLAIAADDDRQTSFLVAEYRISYALLEGLVDQVAVLDKDSVHVLRWFSLHAVP